MLLTIYTRPGCHLCDEMKAIIDRVRRSTPVTLTEIDISTDPDLESQYGTEIPVLTIDGKKVAKYRIAEDDLWRILERRKPDEPGGPGA
jgi:glutaredoxin